MGSSINIAKADDISQNFRKLVKDTLLWVNLAAVKIKILSVLKRLFFFVAIVAFVIALFPRCAKVVSPTGGPKDTIPPVLINSNPAANSTNFREGKMVFEFNEYIQLKDIQQKMIVSPPLKNQPQVKHKGKKFELQITDTLMDNTTYTVYLADAVQDINENNPIPNFEFAFSTGDIIDSLILKGTVVNAFTQQPVESALVMLYDSFTDSLPYVALPKHIVRTNKDGVFIMNNLKAIDYKLVAITDANSNYKYNQGAEDIAFISDTLKREQIVGGTANIILRTFREELPNQIITVYERTQRRFLTVGFSRKPHGQFTLESLDEPTDTCWYIPEPDPQGDTINFWITSNKLAALDSIKVVARYQKTDSLNILHPQTDTLKFVYYAEDANTKSSKSKVKNDTEEEHPEVPRFVVTSSAAKDKIAIPGVPVEFTLPMPATKTDISRILIFNETDSTMEPPVDLKIDSLNPRVYRFCKDWKANTSYRMLLLPGAFEDIASVQNDTLRLQVTGADPENYGSIIIKIGNVSAGAIVQLLNDKGALVTQKAVIGNGQIVLPFIVPGKYRLRFIEDLNKNGVWDTGNYLNGLQPERIFDFVEGKNKGDIKVRANWENEISYSIPNL